MSLHSIPAATRAGIRQFRLACVGSIALALALKLSDVARAQTCHDLSSAWTLNAADSRLASGLSFNPYFAVDAVRLDLREGPDFVEETWQLKGAHVDEKDRYAVPTRGNADLTNVHSSVSSVPVEVLGHWENCTLVEDARTNLFGRTIWTRSRYVMTADGTRLIIEQSSHSNLGDVARLLAFDRTGAPSP